MGPSTLHGLPQLILVIVLQGRNSLTLQMRMCKIGSVPMILIRMLEFYPSMSDYQSTSSYSNIQLPLNLSYKINIEKMTSSSQKGHWCRS